MKNFFALFFLTVVLYAQEYDRFPQFNLKKRFIELEKFYKDRKLGEYSDFFKKSLAILK